MFARFYLLGNHYSAADAHDAVRRSHVETVAADAHDAVLAWRVVADAHDAVFAADTNAVLTGVGAWNRRG